MPLAAGHSRSPFWSVTVTLLAFSPADGACDRVGDRLDGARAQCLIGVQQHGCARLRVRTAEEIVRLIGDRKLDLCLVDPVHPFDHLVELLLERRGVLLLLLQVALAEARLAEVGLEALGGAAAEQQPLLIEHHPCLASLLVSTETAVPLFESW